MCTTCPLCCPQNAGECQAKLDEATDKVSYEKEVNDALQKHMRTLEEAHRNREADWHELSNKWKKYEEDAIAENHRLVGVCA